MPALEYISCESQSNTSKVPAIILESLELSCSHESICTCRRTCTIAKLLIHKNFNIIALPPPLLPNDDLLPVNDSVSDGGSTPDSRVPCSTPDSSVPCDDLFPAAKQCWPSQPPHPSYQLSWPTLQIPPPPPKPDFDDPRAKLTRLREGEDGMSKEQYTKMKQELEAYVCAYISVQTASACVHSSLSVHVM